jgi:hypothetical protein
MNDENLEIFLEDFTDFLNGMEASVVKMKQQIAKLVGVAEKRGWTWNPDKIVWTKAQGSKGEYERSDDVNSLDFKSLLKNLAERKGSLTREGWFYWTFKNGSVVGRKRKVKA